ncbi:MAG: TlpA family protein disulfide reductase [Promethearchaeota archaeon]
MEPEKIAVVGVTLAIVTVGLLIGVSFLTFPTGDADGETPLTGIVVDRDLLELGLEAPTDWTFEMSDDSTLTLSDLRGQVVIVDLMATWCTSCASQNSYLETVYQNLAGTATIISLTVDASETAQMMATYKSDKGLLWDHGVDTGEKFDNYFNVQYIPTIVLIDANGIFRYMHEGIWSAGSISDAVASIL